MFYPLPPPALEWVGQPNFKIFTDTFYFWGGGGVRGAWREELVENIVLGSFGFCNLE